MAAAIRTGRRRGTLIGYLQGPVVEAAVREDVAVKLDHTVAPGTLVQVVDVLSHERQSRDEVRELCERQVAGIGFGFRNEVAAPAIPAPDQHRVHEECIRGGQVLGPVPGPEPFLGIAKGRYAAFRGDAGACQYADMARIPERRNQRVRDLAACCHDQAASCRRT